VLDADIYVVTVKNEKYCVVIGMQNSSPFEVFAGKLNGLSIKINNVKQGKIIRVKRGQYALEFDDIYIEDFSKQFNPVEQILFRMCSMSLQWGVPIIDIVEQLQKSTDDITSLTSAAARILKKYIKNGEKANGQHCPSCGNQLIYTNGCTSCISCGFSKCS
jgi:ribonucleoside-diphosphate reductase alpha chain